MALSVRLSLDDENLLEKVAQTERTPYRMGIDLFNIGKLAKPPSNPLKNQIWEKLRTKHNHMD